MYNKNMEIQEYFKEIETIKEHKGYFCKNGAF